MSHSGLLLVCVCVEIKDKAATRERTENATRDFFLSPSTCTLLCLYICLLPVCVPLRIHVCTCFYAYSCSIPTGTQT